MTRRCVVTGGAGVIGQSLVRKLLERGDFVRVIDLQPPPNSFPGAVDYVQGDLVDIGPYAISDVDPEIIFHLAATFERSDESPEFWKDSQHNNVAASAVVLRGAEQSARLKRYVFASSYLVYDSDLYLSEEPLGVPSCLSEDGSIRPRNVCGAAKLLHEMELQLSTSLGRGAFSAVSARIYRVYGRGSRDVVSRWVRASLSGEPLAVFGAESLFDFVFADDVAEGLVRLAESNATGAVNLGSGRSRSVNEVLACLRTHFPYLDSGDHAPAAVYEASEADLSRLRASTNWTPNTQLEFGVAQLVEHERLTARGGEQVHRLRPQREANALISSLGGKAHVVRGIRQAAQALNLSTLVWGGDLDPMAPARLLVDRFWTMPPLERLDTDVLIGFCASNGISVIIPTRDEELAFFAQHRDLLAAEGVFIPIGNAASIRVTQDKHDFFTLLSAAAVPVIPTALTIDYLDAKVERFVVKPRSGAGGRGVHLDLTSTAAAGILESTKDSIVQPYVEGEEYSVDLYVSQSGDLLGSVARRRARVVGGESKVTYLTERSDLVALAAETVRVSGVRGHVVVQIIDNRDCPVVVECNSRVAGASSVAWAAGLRSIDWMFLEANDEQIMPLRLARGRVTMTRLTEDWLRWE